MGTESGMLPENWTIHSEKILLTGQGYVHHNKQYGGNYETQNLFRGMSG
jgi:hypothetical protein